GLAEGDAQRGDATHAPRGRGVSRSHLSNRLRSRRRRQRYEEGRALARPRFDVQRPAVAVRDRLADRQTDARSRVLFRIVKALERLKDLLGEFLLEADAVIGDRQSRAPPIE